ncbi:hypothetical protein Mzhil_1471 [Methanosalsum zhilinae DSM 4017]|uniref:Flagellin n=1 Tax=Methanosalsum zhilinae (strain DSM 4017 / NBRC 107636 / OCM 62 / WeN5) TaxID=679901 RepID=F7XNV3_METZD|nr:hypothetical protein [Methanosalsum zhilinae]AEH61310.1 hypothetical protein Mzhil_1471 [Methanosalsum zhilinae DSM 4017]
MRDLIDDESAVSVSVGFIITFSVTAIVLVLIMNSFFVMMNQTEDGVTRDEFEMYGSMISSKLSAMDNLIYTVEVNGGEVGELRYELNLPLKIAGNYYSVHVLSEDSEILFVSEGISGTMVSVPYSVNSADVAPTDLYISGNKIYLVYNPSNKSDNYIEIQQ